MKHKVESVDLLNQLEEVGFIHTFKLQDGTLHCVESENGYNPHDLKLVGTFRYEGMSDPDDSRVIYALEAGDGTRGTIVDAHGAYASPELGEFLESVFDARNEHDIMRDLPTKKSIEIFAH